MTFSGTTSLSGTSFSASNFDRSFEVKSVTGTNSFIIQQDANESTGSVTTGTATAKFDINSAPAFSTFGYGWGTNGYGGFSTAVSNLLNGALLDDTAGTGGSGTSITLDSTTDFSTAGKIIVDDEIISYTGKTSTNLTGITRAVDSSTRSAHADDSVVTLFEDSANANAWNIPSNSSSTILDGRDWSIDNFGELMIATALNGSTFQWSPTSDGFAGKASLVTNAPTASKFSLVSTTDRHLILFGTEKTVGTASSQDPLLLRFSSQEDINTYEPRATNTAGSLRIQDGSTIVGADKARGQILVWTDTSLHGLQFIGPPFTFGLNQLGMNCGLLGQHAAVVVRDVSYWMGQNAFFAFDGTVKKLPCTVEQFIFNNINVTGAENAFAGHNGEFNEIMWFYPRTGSNEINAIVAYNYLEGTWWTGTLDRTTWIDREVYENPVATDYLPTTIANNETISGLTDGATQLFLHETGNNADGEAITAFVKSGVVQIGEGNEFSFVSKLIPDIEDQEGTLNAKLEFKNYPNNSTAVTKTVSFQDNTDFVSLRGRGREFTVNVVSNTTGTAWRLGTQRFDIQPDGRR